jgi:hypothetical protein
LVSIILLPIPGRLRKSLSSLSIFVCL